MRRKRRRPTQEFWPCRQLFLALDSAQFGPVPLTLSRGRGTRAQMREEWGKKAAPGRKTNDRP